MSAAVETDTRLHPTRIIARWLIPRIGMDPTDAARELLDALRAEGWSVVRTEGDA